MNYAPSQPGDRDPDPPELEERRDGDLLVLIEDKSVDEKAHAWDIKAFIAGIPREVKP